MWDDDKSSPKKNRLSFNTKYAFKPFLPLNICTFFSCIPFPFVWNDIYLSFLWGNLCSHFLLLLIRLYDGSKVLKCTKSKYWAIKNFLAKSQWKTVSHKKIKKISRLKPYNEVWLFKCWIESTISCYFSNIWLRPLLSLLSVLLS